MNKYKARSKQPLSAIFVPGLMRRKRPRGELMMEDLLHPTAQGCVTLQVTPPPNEVTGSSAQ